MTEKIRDRRSHATETAASYTNEMLVKAMELAFVIGAWLLYDACQSEIGTRGLVIA